MGNGRAGGVSKEDDGKDGLRLGLMLCHVRIYLYIRELRLHFFLGRCKLELLLEFCHTKNTHNYHQASIGRAVGLTYNVGVWKSNDDAYSAK